MSECKFCHQILSQDNCNVCGRELASLREVNVIFNGSGSKTADIYITDKYLFIRNYTKFEQIKSASAHALGGVVSTVAMIKSGKSTHYNYVKYGLNNIKCIVYPYNKKLLVSKKKCCKIVFYDGQYIEFIYDVLAKYLKGLIDTFSRCGIAVVENDTNISYPIQNCNVESNSSLISDDLPQNFSPKFCDRCGNKLNSSDKFCDKCGKNVF